RRGTRLHDRPDRLYRRLRPSSPLRPVHQGVPYLHARTDRTACSRTPGPLRQPGPSYVPGGGLGMSLLVLSDVKVHFPVRKGVLFDRTVGHVYAVDGVSLKVEAGQTYGLVGESGCGKTTLGRGVLRLGDITDGEVVFDGTDLAKLPEEEMRRF